MEKVIIESPYAGDVERNITYARRAMEDSLRRCEAPYLSHLLYPQVLDDEKPAERMLGIEAGLAIGAVMDKTVVYADYGISSGMQKGILRAVEHGRDVEVRSIGPNPLDADAAHSARSVNCSGCGTGLEITATFCSGCSKIHVDAKREINEHLDSLGFPKYCGPFADRVKDALDKPVLTADRVDGWLFMRDEERIKLEDLRRLRDNAEKVRFVYAVRVEGGPVRRLFRRRDLASKYVKVWSTAKHPLYITREKLYQ